MAPSGPSARHGDPDAPLRGARILATRSADRARDLVELLEADGARVRLAPLLEAVLPADPGPVSDLLERAADPGPAARTWLAVTSVNTVRALERVAGAEATGPPRSLGERLATARRAGLRVAAVGDATAAALAAAGLPPDLVPGGAHSAAGLLAEWPAEPAPGTVLIPLSARARPDLAAGLTERGYRVVTATAYETVPWPAPAPLAPSAPAPGGTPVLERAEVLAELGRGELDAVVLTAPSHLAELVGADPGVLAGTALVAIGEPTRRAAAERGLCCVAAALPTAEGIRDALVRALSAPGPASGPAAAAPRRTPPSPHRFPHRSRSRPL